MDINTEDKIHHQIEKNLSKNINRELFTTGGNYENEIKKTEAEIGVNSRELYPISTRKEEAAIVAKNSEDQSSVAMQEANEAYPPQQTMSRAEYIRQAREACLRQMQSSGDRTMDTYSFEAAESNDRSQGINHIKTMNLFRSKANDGETEQDIASFRSLVIRTVCAVVLFLSIFIIDKFEISIGKVSHTVIQDYVTGIDHLEKLESFVVSLLK